MRIRRAAFVAITLAIGALASLRASAHMVVWELGGTVDEIGFAIDEPDRTTLLASWQIELGAPWSGRISFEASAEPVATFDPSTVSFRDPRTRLVFAVGSLSTATAAWDLAGTAVLNRAMPIADSLTFSASMTGSSLPALQSFLAYLELVAPYGEVFAATSLPSNPPDLEDLIPRAADPQSALTGTHFNYVGFALLPGVEAPLPFTLDGRVTRLVRVPEPGTLLVLLPLIAVLVGRVRRRRTQRSGHPAAHTALDGSSTR